MTEKPVDIIEVFIGNFISATNNAELTHLLHLLRCMLYIIHAIFMSSEITQHGGGDSVLDKKLDKGYGTWVYGKEILGLIFNGL